MPGSTRRALLASIFASLVLAGGPGRWSNKIDFPLVPVSGAVRPDTGELLVWSSYANDRFDATQPAITQTAVYNPKDGTVGEYTVTESEHDMFCPGISMDFNGDLLVTGGDTSSATSRWDQFASKWSKAPNMKLPRGYQSSATLSDGRIFTIGGSWNEGADGNGPVKDGEIWDGASSSWTLLPGATVQEMLTEDTQGKFRSDNHPWLFGWKEGSVFQAGPSKAMNWYSTAGEGGVTPAGQRGDDGHAMCGPAVMYDAVNGKILATGGSPDYQMADATANAHIITIGDVGQNAEVKKVADMAQARIFANSIVLPGGEVYVIGGQTFGNPFRDENATLSGEIWSWQTEQFTTVADSPTPRTYHSIALLMPDATVFVGGGGLCGDCGDYNHFDGHFYSPPYLFSEDGQIDAQRPVIENVSTRKPEVGSELQATMAEGTEGDIIFSMVRMGSSTHTINTDQRRVSLEATAKRNTWSVQLPNDAGILLPGFWYLFAMANGVPSEAQIVQVVPTVVLPAEFEGQMASNGTMKRGVGKVFMG